MNITVESVLDINNIAYPLPIEVNVDKLLNEVETLIIPKMGKLSVPGDSCSITGNQNTPLDQWFRSNRGAMTKVIDPKFGVELDRKFSKFQLGFLGGWRDDLQAYYEDGTADRSLVKWHPDLVNSEILALNDRVAKFLKISSVMRCRLSLIQGPYSLPKHADPHTPWRVHVNLKSGPGTHWTFYDVANNQRLDWCQPTGSVWLMRTGDIQHSVTVGPGDVRWQLFYHIWQKNLGPDYYQFP